ncbi:MAG: TetR/AcrR family transcriptional regulator [Tatlockia sp.]|nr:TetR/AcrR family transcriptional regulator [Tatlockia sp.]
MSTSNKSLTTKSTYHHGNLLDELKKNAIGIIATQGLSKINLRDLAIKSGVSATSVYRHYKNKEHLLAVIAEEGFTKLHQTMLATQEPNKFQKIGIAYIHFALQHRVHFQLMFGPFLEKKNYPALLNASTEAYQVLRIQIEQGIDQGVMIGDVDSLTRTAWATVHGTAVLLLDNQFVTNNNEVLDCEQIATEVTRILGKGLYTHHYMENTELPT